MVSDGDQFNASLAQFKNKLFNRLQDDFRAIQTTAPTAATIYHYTDLGSALKVIETKQFWFTERAHLNDTLELQYGLAIAQEIFDAAANDAPDILKPAADQLKEEVLKGLGDYGYWVASFSYRDNDLSQWRSYADEGRGVCLGFSVQDLDMLKFAHHLDSFRINCLRFPVQYDEAELRDCLRPYIDLAIEFLRSVNLPSWQSYSEPDGEALGYERAILTETMSGLYLHSMRFKHEAYKHESEYRLALNADRLLVEPSPYHKVRARGGEVVGYLDLPIPNWPGALTHVVMGPAAAPRLEEQLTTAFRSFGLSLPNLDRSKIPFRTTR